MASINISLKEEAYQRLEALKRPDESFSDEILRLTEKKTGENLMRAFEQMGSLSRGSEREFEEGAKKSKMKMAAVLKKWEGQ